MTVTQTLMTVNEMKATPLLLYSATTTRYNRNRLQI